MFNLLVKFFIKDKNNYSDSKVRAQYGVLCGAFGIFLNVILFTLKLIFGLLSKSVAIIADAINNLSDAASSFVQILGFKLSSKKPDSDHPFGHGRMEYISGLIISFLILLMGFELFKTSIKNLFSGQTTSFSFVTLGILIFSIAIKFYMFLYNHKIAQKIKSVSMEATAKDSLSDMISTFIVIISIVASKFTVFPVDAIAGIIVAFFILKTGFESAKDTIDPLLGQAPTAELVNDIYKELMKFEPICGMHDLIVHDYGPGRLMVSLHAEVPGDMDIFELHDIIDIAENTIAQKFNCSAIIHMDPIDTKNTHLEELKKILKEKLVEIHPDLTCHDIRMVPGPTHTNLIFDVIKPFECNLSDSELKSEISKKMLTNCNNVYCVITIDQPFV